MSLAKYRGRIYEDIYICIEEGIGSPHNIMATNTKMIVLAMTLLDIRN